jgi:16S rRNA (cytosine967-C5)-methyltransferase
VDVLGRRVPLDDALESRASSARLNARDAALAQAIATVSFRRYGTLRHALSQRLPKGVPPDKRLVAVLVTGAAQILFLDIADHAAVDLAVRLAHGGKGLQRAAGMINAVLRRISREREAILAGADPLRLDTPEWLARRWAAAYGAGAAHAIAAAHVQGAAVDITVRAEPERWAERLGGILLPTASVRLVERTPVSDLPGYAQGVWWVQDAAAALPARVLGPRPGERIADLCAAPGGKTAQLASAGARVLAVDKSTRRMRRLTDNMARLNLHVDTRTADVLDLEEEAFDAALLDAPCSATGTIRRHPDVPWGKQEDDIGKLAGLQRRLLDKTAALIRPGGRLVYCTCSLEPEEGEDQIEDFLRRHTSFRRIPVVAGEVGGLSYLINGHGDVRTLPCHDVAGPVPGPAGLDGFFIARLARLA